MTDFLPINKQDMEARGWDELDFILVSGDAYIDHPSFGHAIISRVLEREGFKVGIIPQPDWTNVENFRILGQPKYAFLVSPGNIDSMVNHYTVNKKIRRQDSYSPGGESGHRPDRATIVYTSKIKQAYKGIPVIVGGIESSLRRLGHYDYWSNKVRHSILLDSKADLLIYGMGEYPIVEIAKKLKKGKGIKEITDVRGTVYATSKLPKDAVELPTFEDIKTDKQKFSDSFYIQHKNTDPFTGKVLAEKDGSRYVIQNRPSFPLKKEDFDAVYTLPYTKTYHPIYEKDGGVPALKEVEFSITNNRGCFGSCSFCALTFHQGRIVTSRSSESVLKEAKELTSNKNFKGYIHDVGGPTANFTEAACDKQKAKGSCPEKDCLGHEMCSNVKVDHSEYLKMLRNMRQIPGIKKVFIRSGLRFDYLLKDSDDSFFKELCEHHISGQLKIAPEHVSNSVLKVMGKPKHEVFERFISKFQAFNKKLGKKQFFIPYFISSHPGSTLQDGIKLAEYLKTLGFTPDQVQDFYPTPGTLSTAMFYTGINPETGKKVFVATEHKDKQYQRALLQFNRPENYLTVLKALQEAGRSDLIGTGNKALIPQPSKKGKQQRSRGKQNFTKC
ncbi:MAG: YgiQ family radical SAM protein [Spirochaetaceae bacterium]